MEVAPDITLGQASGAINTFNARPIAPLGLVPSNRGCAVSGSLPASTAPEPGTVRWAMRRARWAPGPAHGRGLERLGQQDDISRAAAGDGGGRVDQALILHPGHPSRRAEQGVAHLASLGLQAGTGEGAGDALAGGGGGVGRGPHHPRLSTQGGTDATCRPARDDGEAHPYVARSASGTSDSGPSGGYIPGSLVWPRSGRRTAGHAETADLLSCASPVRR